MTMYASEKRIKNKFQNVALRMRYENSQNRDEQNDFPKNRFSKIQERRKNVREFPVIKVSFAECDF